MRLQDKRALITAAGAGIGRASALAMAAEGAQVLATDINAQALEDLKGRHPNLNTRYLDVTDGAAVQAVADEVGGLDVLFNCAGFVHHGTLLDCDEAAWALSLQLNVTSVYRLTKALLPAMIARGGGSIINMSSVASSITGAPNRFVYGVTKAAVIGLTKSIARDYVKDGIRCNAICPGTVATPSLEERIRAQGGDYQAVLEQFVGRQPMGRLGRAEEVAALVVYLAADESAYTTGTVQVIDGGWTM
ncbi:MAG: SDR family oxidoreductase [Candidatus Competibacterales bacterium]